MRKRPAWRERTMRDPVFRETGGQSKRRLEQVLVAHCLTCFFAALHAELPIDAADLGFDGVDGDDQCLGDLRVGVAGHQQAQHPFLLWAEWREGLSWNRIA